MTAADPVGLAVKYFLNRLDVSASKASWGRPAPIHTRETAQAIDWLEAHVYGRKVRAGHVGEARNQVFCDVRRVGAYSYDREGKCRWLCVDFDGASHGPGRLEDPLGEADAAMIRAAAYGVPAYLERSNSGDSWHLWIFFEKPQEPVTARQLAWALLDIPPGETPRKGIDIFPSADRPSEIGCMVWLPWWREAKVGLTQFYRPDGAELELWQPDGFDRLGDVAGTIARMCRPAPPPKIIVPPPPAIVRATYVPPLPAGRAFQLRDNDELWREWKRKAILHVDLGDIYGPAAGPVGAYGLESVLVRDETGRSQWKRRSNAWFLARCPSSPTRDRDPSASVATGAGRAERGTFSSFITHDEPVDVLRYLEKFRRMSTQDARKHLAQLSGVPLPEFRPKIVSRHEQQAQRLEPGARPMRRAQ